MAAYIVMLISIGLWAVMEKVAPTIGDDAVIIRALACTCPDYKVLGGLNNLSRPLLDTILNLERGEIFVTGAVNYYAASYSNLYDDYAIHGKVVGVKQVYEGAPWDPLVEVNTWKHLVLMPYMWIKRMAQGILLLAQAMFFWSRKEL